MYGYHGDIPTLPPNITDCQDKGGTWSDEKHNCIIPLQNKMGPVGFILRGKEEECFIWCKWDWARAAVPAAGMGLLVSGVAKKGGWWKGGLASVATFFGAYILLPKLNRGPSVVNNQV